MILGLSYLKLQLDVFQLALEIVLIKGTLIVDTVGKCKLMQLVLRLQDLNLLTLRGILSLQILHVFVLSLHGKDVYVLPNTQVFFASSKISSRKNMAVGVFLFGVVDDSYALVRSCIKAFLRTLLKGHKCFIFKGRPCSDPRRG